MKIFYNHVYGTMEKMDIRCSEILAKFVKPRGADAERSGILLWATRQVTLSSGDLRMGAP